MAKTQGREKGLLRPSTAGRDGGDGDRPVGVAGLWPGADRRDWGAASASNLADPCPDRCSSLICLSSKAIKLIWSPPKSPGSHPNLALPGLVGRSWRGKSIREFWGKRRPHGTQHPRDPQYPMRGTESGRKGHTAPHHHGIRGRSLQPRATH